MRSDEATRVAMSSGRGRNPLRRRDARASLHRGEHDPINGGLKLARRHFARFAGAAACAIVPAFAIQAVVTHLLGPPPAVPLIFSSIAVVPLVGQALATLAVTFAAARLLEQLDLSRDSSPAALFRALLGRRLLGLVPAGLAIAAPLLVFFVPSVWLWTVVAVVENDGPVASLRRSVALTSGRWQHAVYVALAALVFTTLAATPLVLGAQALAASLVDPVRLALLTATGAAISILVVIVQAPMSVALYQELRSDHEDGQPAGSNPTPSQPAAVLVDTPPRTPRSRQAHRSGHTPGRRPHQ